MAGGGGAAGDCGTTGAELQTVRERMAAFLNRNGVEVVCAYPQEGRQRRSGPVAAVSLRACQGRPGGFQDYLGERYDPERGRWQELYGRRVILTFGLDLYAPRASGAEGIQTAYDRMAEAFQWEGPTGLALRELSCGETEYDPEAGLYRRQITAVCQGYLYAVADEEDSFLDFIVRGEGRFEHDKP